MAFKQDLASVAPNPPELAKDVRDALRDKSELPILAMATLGVLAGVYIALGGLFSTVALAGADGLPHGIGQVLAGVVFTLGLVLVIIAGAELFTGNTLMTGLLATGALSWGSMARAWAIVYAGNLAGSLLIAGLAFAADVHSAGDGAVGRVALESAESKTALRPATAFASGVLANMLVCLAVWISYSARTTTDKFFAVLLPIAGFVAVGLEHSVANMFLVPYGWSIRTFAGARFWEEVALTAGNYASISVAGFLSNLVSVTLGNIVGGSAVALAYTLAYRRNL